MLKAARKNEEEELELRKKTIALAVRAANATPEDFRAFMSGGDETAGAVNLNEGIPPEMQPFVVD